MTKEIELTQDKITIVDDCDYEDLIKYKWCANKRKNYWYAMRQGNQNGQGYLIGMHRQILGFGYKDGMMIDHINRDGLDNRRSNLRVSNHILNARNSKLQANNTSGFKGVSWCKARGKWLVQICVRQKNIRIGLYDDKMKAVHARLQAEQDFWLP